MLGIKRVLAIFAVLSALVWAGSAAVQANPNRMQLLVGDLSGNFCGKAVGPILLHIDAKEYFKTYATKDGGTRMEVNGRAFVTVTTGRKSLVFNASGPGTVYFAHDGSLLSVVSRGQVFYIGTNGGLWVFEGHIVTDPAGNLVATSGHVTDVCALLH